MGRKRDEPPQVNARRSRGAGHARGADDVRRRRSRDDGDDRDVGRQQLHGAGRVDDDMERKHTQAHGAVASRWSQRGGEPRRDGAAPWAHAAGPR